MGVFKRQIRGRRAELYSAKFMFRGQLYQRGGFPDRDTAQHWIDSTRVSLRRGEVGYVKARTAAKVLPLIEEYADHLRSLKRSDKYAYNSEMRLKKIAAEAPLMTLSDVTAARFESWRSSKPKYRGRVIAARTLNQYLDHAQEFGDWLVKPKQLLPVNPLTQVSSMTALPNDHYRRAATLEELTKLLAKAPADRSIVYRFLIYVPLRRRAMESIVWRDFILSGDRASFTLRAGLNKNKHEIKLAVRQDLAQALLLHRGSAEDDDRVFAAIPSTDELRDDLKAAGVSFSDAKGNRRLDLHAFRKTVIRLLKKSGVSLDEAHVFLQHRDRRTTEKYYDDDLVAPEISHAAEKMPAIEIPAGVGAHLGADGSQELQEAGK